MDHSNENLELKKKLLCPLPWLHFSANTDTSMRICCNTDYGGLVHKNDGSVIHFSEVTSLNDYFNLDELKEIRSKMLRGEKPRQCNKCYEIEEYGGVSPRNGYFDMYSKSLKWLKQLAQTQKDGTIKKSNVSSVDLSISNKCNLKCVMCSPNCSELIKKDYDQLGFPYDKEYSQKASRLWSEADNFQDIMSSLSKDLNFLTTTGGEPLLNKMHLEQLENLVKSGDAPRINLTYNTNGTVLTDKILNLWKNFKCLYINISADGVGKLNEYIRYGTNWEKYEKNVAVFNSLENSNCEVQVTLQAINVFSLPDIYEWLKNFPKMDQMPYHSWMSYPQWQMVTILPKHLIQKALDNLNEYFAKNPDPCAGSSMDIGVWNERRRQIRSYLERALDLDQDLEGLDEFKRNMRKIENLRGLPPIEELVPELREIF